MGALILVKGAGDLATGIAHCLYRSGFQIAMTEIEKPTVIRRGVSFAEAVYEGNYTVEGVTSRLAGSIMEVKTVLAKQEIPVIIDPSAETALCLNPLVVVDAIMAKKNRGTGLADAPLVIGIGPGFCAAIDVHAVVETKRGHNLGRVILDGSAEPDTGIPGSINGLTSERLIKAPTDGIFTSYTSIGSLVKAGDLLGVVGDVPVRATISGVLRGLIRGGLLVSKSLKIGDIDPRGNVEYCFTISDKARTIAGGVLEAILWLGKTRILQEAHL